MKLVQLKPEHLNAAMEVVGAATDAMTTQGIDQWDGVYPSEAKIREDIELQSLFGALADERLVAIAALNEIQSPEYAQIKWQDQKGRPLIVHRLCVHPHEQGKGLARSMMEFAESFAEDQSFTSIRLDAFTKNPAAVRLYESLAYKAVGTVEFRKGTFFCFEKLLWRPLGLRTG